MLFMGLLKLINNYINSIWARYVKNDNAEEEQLLLSLPPENLCDRQLDHFNGQLENLHVASKRFWSEEMMILPQQCSKRKYCQPQRSQLSTDLFREMPIHNKSLVTSSNIQNQGSADTSYGDYLKTVATVIALLKSYNKGLYQDNDDLKAFSKIPLEILSYILSMLRPDSSLYRVSNGAYVAIPPMKDAQSFNVIKVFINQLDATNNIAALPQDTGASTCHDNCFV